MPFKPLSCVYGKVTIPQRFIVGIMLQLALINSYHLRVVLNIAITEMIRPPQEQEKEYDSCPEFKHEKLDIKGGTFDWPTWLRAFILYAFFIGYALSQLPGGWLADRIGARHVMGTCMLVSITVSLVFPISVEYGGHQAAIGLRAVLGLAQGPMYPTTSSFLQKWAPVSERTFLAGIAFSGGNLGAFTGNLLTGVIIKETSNWPNAFYAWAVVAFVWYIFYLFMVFSRPSTHPFITEKELKMLSEELEESKKFVVPWTQILRSVPVYCILLSQLAHDYTYFTLVTDLPKYMKDILKLNIKDNATFSAIPFLILGLSNVLFSKLSDFMIKRGCRTVVMRKVYSFVGNVFPAICMVTAAHIGCTRAGAITLYTVGMFFMGLYYPGTMVNINDISRHYSGTIMALTNGLCSLTGIVGTFVVGHLTPHGTIEEWRKVFWIVFGVCTINTTIYVIFGKVDRQPWDYPKEEKEEEEGGGGGKTE
ncbi:putative inorganic phosphate cotransporter [Anoplophora glabripennis]|uniref:putative inorganic phosphate cotransporter n=1 Tax=Anoplophora glabripennis TaxID=217634 RepID=UPI0008747F4E|nr:putative inorganic phosphate cotransporter [Anoplophora glabripennis]